MPSCKTCGKYTPDKNIKPTPKTWDEFVDAWNSIPCTSFTFCSECFKKYFNRKVEE